jgi:hypothetical protein
MASVILDKQISREELEQIIKKGFPNYLTSWKAAYLLVDTGIQGKFTVQLSGKKVYVYPWVSPLLAILMGLTIIGLLFLIPFTTISPLAKEIANHVKENCDNTDIQSVELSKIPDTCPHCKNPNSKRIRSCEWCGHQII